VEYAPAATDAAVAATTDGDPREDATTLTVATNATDRTARLGGEAVTPDVRVDSRTVQFGTTRRVRRRPGVSPSGTTATRPRR
jgi:hypothetical protein